MKHLFPWVCAGLLSLVVLASPARAQSELNNDEAQHIRELVRTGQGVLLPLDGALDPPGMALTTTESSALEAMAVEETTMPETAKAASDDSTVEATLDTMLETAEPAEADAAAAVDEPVAGVTEDSAPAPEEAAAAEAAAQALPEVGDAGGIVVAELGNPESIGPYRLWLATLRTVREAQASWELLAWDNGDVLGDLKPVIVLKDLGGDSETFFRLQAGPLASESAAQERCELLKSRTLYCAILGPDDG